MNDEIAELITMTANSFRLGMEGQGAELLSILTDKLMLMMSSFQGQDINKLNQILESVIQSQIRKDYSYLADMLEYELVHVVQ